MKISNRRPLRSIIPALLIWMASWSMVSFAAAQDFDSQMEKAESYQKDGFYEDAFQIYLQLYQTHQDHLVLIDRLKQVCSILGRQDIRTGIITAQLGRDSLNAALLVELGDALYKNKENDKAFAAWEKAVSIDPSDLLIYKITASTLLENRLFEAAAETYKRARGFFKNENLFIREAASLYTFQKDFKKATEEYLLFLKFNPAEFEFVQKQIGSFPNDYATNTQVIGVLKAGLTRNPDNHFLHQLILDAHFRNLDYASAYEQARVIDELIGAKGKERLKFAQLAFNNEAFKTAEKAYTEFIEDFADSPEKPVAEFGLARAFEKLGSGLVFYSSNDSVSALKELSYNSRAIEAYSKLLKTYHGTQWAAEAYFRIGEIKLYRFFDIDGAIESYQKALIAFPQTRLKATILFQIAEAYATKGNLSLALDQYGQVLKVFSKDRAVRDRAKFLVAEAMFYQLDFDSTQALLSSISEPQEGFFVNDALGFILFLSKGVREKDVLTEYARAAFLKKQNKASEAALIVSSALADHPGTKLADDLLLMEGDLSRITGEGKKAIDRYAQVVSMPESPLADVAQMRIGEVFEHDLKDIRKAVEAYTRLLVDFPKSIYIDVVRKKIRILKQSVIPTKSS